MIKTYLLVVNRWFKFKSIFIIICKLYFFSIHNNVNFPVKLVNSEQQLLHVGISDSAGGFHVRGRGHVGWSRARQRRKYLPVRQDS